MTQIDNKFESVNQANHMIWCTKKLKLVFLSDFNECELQPCGNGGTCVNTPGSYYCNCLPGYTGPDCGTGKLRCYKPHLDE